MDLQTFLSVMRRRFRIVLGVLLVCLLFGVGLTLFTKPRYTATTQLFVSTGGEGSVASLAEGNSFVQARVQSYADIVTSPSVLEPVVEKLGLRESARQLATDITATAPLNKVLIELSVQQSTASGAAAVANAVAAQFADVVSQLDSSSETASSAVRLTVTQPAVIPGAPSSPNKLLNVTVAAILGLILGVGLALVRSILDTTIKSSDDLAAFEPPVVAIIPFDKGVAQSPVAFRGEPHGRRSEAFRLLRTQVHFLGAGTASQVVAVLSSLPQEGKTHTSVNLAAAIAESGQRVCLVEADLRRPTVAKAIGLVSEVGLTSVLVGDLDLEDALQNAGLNFAVLTSGPVPPNPSELLGSSRMTEVLETLKQNVDVVVIDTAPLLAVADALELAAEADIRLVVTRSGKTRRPQLLLSFERLRNAGLRADGLVLGFESKRGSQEYYYYGADKDVEKGRQSEDEPAADVQELLR